MPDAWTWCCCWTAGRVDEQAVRAAPAQFPSPGGGGAGLGQDPAAVSGEAAGTRQVRLGLVQFAVWAPGNERQALWAPPAGGGVTSGGRRHRVAAGSGRGPELPRGQLHGRGGVRAAARPREDLPAGRAGEGGEPVPHFPRGREASGADRGGGRSPG